ncbi:MAG: hypothetical protein GY719_07035 [bacterium]|nr:hypothetical protein [bacterium]
MSTRISPNYADGKFENASTEDLIDVFEDRMRYWLIEPAKALQSLPHGFVASISLLLTYFEGYAIFKAGKDSKGQSKKFFRTGFSEVFSGAGIKLPVLEKTADFLYSQARCGFFHDALFREKILFSEAYPAVLLLTFPKVNGKLDTTASIESLVIRPSEFLRYVEGHFENYVGRLRNKTEAEVRDRFNSAVSRKWRPNRAGPILGMSEAEFFENPGAR